MTLNCWELLRALGAVATDPAAATALDLPPCGTAEHSEVFAFNCPPYASAYLGDDSARLAAFWTAIGLDVPAEPDHLSTLLDLYARLGEAGGGPAPLRQAPLRRTLFREHLWPWLPAYLGAVGDLPAGALAPWAALTLDALRREREPGRDPDGLLPVALREAPFALREAPVALREAPSAARRLGRVRRAARRAHHPAAQRHHLDPAGRGGRRRPVRGRAADRGPAAGAGRHAGRRTGTHHPLAGGRGGPLVAVAPGRGS